MRRVNGVRVFAWVRGLRRRDGGQRLPRTGEKWYYVQRVRGLLLVQWRAYRGYRLISWHWDVPPSYEVIETFGTGWENMAMKKRELTLPGGTLPFLSPETKAWAKYPTLVEFLSATAWEDGTARTPGYVTVRNRIIEYEITLYDPNVGQRIAIRARTLDQCFSGADTILGASEAPWETDQYLTERLPKKKKK